MKMQMGAHKGKEIDELPTPYLAWVISQDMLRFRRWSLIEEILRVLGERFGDLEKLKAELYVAEAPPTRWKTAERDAARKEARAARRAALGERRRAQLKRIADDLRERMARTGEAPRQPGVWKDASYFAREARLAAQRDSDVSDLV